MRRHPIPFMLLLSTVACLPDAPVKLESTFEPVACGSNPVSTLPTISIFAGSLDISATSTYLLQTSYVSDLQAPNPPSSPESNDFVANQLVSVYTGSTFQAAGTQTTTAFTIPQDVQSMYAVVPAQAGAPGAATGTGPGNWILADILGPQAVNALATKLTNPGDVVNLQVAFQLKGALRSGQAESSTVATYPITVYNGGFNGACQTSNDCFHGQVCIKSVCTCGTNPVAASGPCGTPGGQDGTFIGCCTGATDGGTAPKIPGC